MKKAVKHLTLCAAGFGALSLISAPVQAEPKGYLGAGFNILTYSESGVEDASLTAVTANLGVKFNDYIGAELRVGVGASGDTVTVYDSGYVIPVDVDINNLVSTFVRVGFPASEKFHPYFLLGRTKGKVDYEAYGYQVSESDNSMSYGFGADLMLTEEAAVSFEYVSYFDKSEQGYNTEIGGMVIGVKAFF